jgi:hypothetical protein
MTSQLIAFGLFTLVVIGSFDSLENMTNRLNSFQVPNLNAGAEVYISDDSEQAEINYLLDDLDKTYA